MRPSFLSRPQQIPFHYIDLRQTWIDRARFLQRNERSLLPLLLWIVREKFFHVRLRERSIRRRKCRILLCRKLEQLDGTLVSCPRTFVERVNPTEIRVVRLEVCRLSLLCFRCNR